MEKGKEIAEEKTGMEIPDIPEMASLGGGKEDDQTFASLAF